MTAAAERDLEAGQILLQLERRQDDVLSQLDDLEQKLSSILRGLGVTLADDQQADIPAIRLADLGDEDEYEELSELSTDAEPVHTPITGHAARDARRNAA